MKRFTQMNRAQLLEAQAAAQNEYDDFLARGVSINMARGRPSPEQLDLSDELLAIPRDRMGVESEDGTDCRNYGALCGIPECRRLFGEIMGYPAENVIACGSSSLTLMYDYISQCMTHGTAGEKPWIENENRKFIAVVPGYDRHFAIAEHFGLSMVCVPMTRTGPDMDALEKAVLDPDVKGMFCVPKYSNPDGVTYSDETVERLAAMKTGAKDFRVIWDLAYVVHDLYEEKDVLRNAYETAKKYGAEDRFVAFASTSKITFAGAGVSAVAASDRISKEIVDRLKLQIISYDKINQLRHCFLYKNLSDIEAQMKRHAAILRPKFDAVLNVLDERLAGLGIADWNRPRGGYFISLDVTVGSAKYVGELCKACGLTLTGVGATYPYGKDPNDRNIRIAPSCPDVQALETATRILSAAVKLAACRELLAQAE